MSDRYQIKSKIGSGGIGAVYRAFDTELKREVAIKRLLNQEHKPEEARKTAEYLINEAGLMSKLQHPNIVSVYDVGLDDEGAFIVMEFIKGETMSETVKRGALTLKDFLPVVEQSLEALVCAQEAGMLHRDIKPSNVMIRWLPSGSFQLKILDFGLAKISEQPSLQTIDHGNSILGSIYFMSPEQLEREPLDQRTDLYSLGCLFYYTLAGAFPFKGDSAPEVMVAHLEHEVKPLHQIRPDVPAVVCDFIMNLMACNRNDRPQDARTALSLIESIAAELPKKALQKQSTPPVSASQPEQTQPDTSTHNVAGSRRLLTGTAPQPAGAGAALSTTAHFRPPLSSKKSGKPWVLPVAVALIAIFGGLWFLIRDDSKANSNDLTDSSKIPPETIPDDTDDAPDVSIPENDPDVLLPFGSAWKYLPPGQHEPDNWISMGLDDSSWLSGPSPIGYGEDDLATDIRNDAIEASSRPITTFYRSEFVSSRENIDGFLDIRFHVDDALVLYMNGYEVLRRGLPGGEIDRNTRSIRNAFANAETASFRAAVPRHQLRRGRNVLAVRVHQIVDTSSDAQFDMEVRAFGGPETAAMTARPAGDEQEIVPTSATANVEWSYRFNQPKGTWYQDRYNENAKTWKKGIGVAATADAKNLPAGASGRPRIEWKGSDIWLRRGFELTEDDLKDRDRLALKIIHDDNVTVHLNGRIAAESAGYRKDYVILPIQNEAEKELRPGTNTMSIHCLNNDGPGIVDVGIVRLKK